mgnify:FL=1
MKAPKNTMFLAVICMVLTLLVNPVNVYAANAELTFGSEEYTQSNGSEFHIGAYITADESIGDYNVQIKYDNLRLEFVDGADNVDTEKGIITLSGNERKSKIKFWLKFHAISGGEANLEFVEGTVSDYEVVTYATAPIHISGEDTAAQIEAERAAEEPQDEQEGQEASGDGDTDSSQAEEEQNQAAQDNSQGQQSGQDTIASQSTSDTNEQDNVQESTDKHSIIFNVFFVAMIAILFVIILVVSIVWALIKRSRKKEEAGKEAVGKIQADKKQKTTEKQKAKKNLQEIKKEKDLPVEDLSIEELNGMMDNLKTEVQNMMYESAIQEEWGAEPVIKVCDVTMEFHLSSVNPSGLKEYMIQLIKREVKYKRLFALYHVSFNVYKGEIVGIIGTNGSGKSTLLKIVSGALKPTSGHVEVDRRKIQLLTLGTGFDMELTARENVFLNGSIIGYSREFLESHYDEIVAFAELEDFMDQKVKNFSSGMVSRLGFSIATAGDAAEILILDEVLSVGDEFFRKKSLKRVKEMIHGGSTVLMVSHGMGTIIDNCTKCVWIEKGELRMVGEPKDVCAEYKNLEKISSHA